MGPSWVNTTRAALECRRFASKVLFLSGAAETEICVASLPQGCRKVDVRSDPFFRIQGPSRPKQKSCARAEISVGVSSCFFQNHKNIKKVLVGVSSRFCQIWCGDVEQFTPESRKAARIPQESRKKRRFGPIMSNPEKPQGFRKDSVRKS